MAVSSTSAILVSVAFVLVSRRGRRSLSVSRRPSSRAVGVSSIAQSTMSTLDIFSTGGRIQDEEANGERWLLGFFSLEL